MIELAQALLAIICPLMFGLMAVDLVVRVSG